VSFAESQGNTTTVLFSEILNVSDAAEAVATLFASLAETVPFTESVIAVLGEYFGPLLPPIPWAVRASPSTVAAVVSSTNWRVVANSSNLFVGVA
jgi:hypothetical protein